MLNLTEELKSLSLKAFNSLFEQDLDENLIQIQPTRKEFEGSHTLVCFPLGRFSKLSPEKTAEAIGNFMKENSDLVSGFNVVKGFLNIVFADKVCCNSLLIY